MIKTRGRRSSQPSTRGEGPTTLVRDRRKKVYTCIDVIKEASLVEQQNDPGDVGTSEQPEHQDAPIYALATSPSSLTPYQGGLVNRSVLTTYRVHVDKNLVILWLWSFESSLREICSSRNVIVRFWSPMFQVCKLGPQDIVIVGFWFILLLSF